MPVDYMHHRHHIGRFVLSNELNARRVLPIYKNGNRNYEGNYRPVSILPVASKVLDKIVYNQMHKYLEQNNLIYAFQSGFRSAHSTSTDSRVDFSSR